MDTIAQAFYDGLFADLSYVDKLAPGLTGEPLEKAIRGRIPQVLAAAVGGRFEVLAVTDEQPSDYQAAVFRDRRNGIIYVAHRGTESSADILGADVDLALVSGTAEGQPVAANAVSAPDSADALAGDYAGDELSDAPTMLLPMPFVPDVRRSDFVGSVAAPLLHTVSTVR